jgi:hypothetical protein
MNKETAIERQLSKMIEGLGVVVDSEATILHEFALG